MGGTHQLKIHQSLLQKVPKSRLKEFFAKSNIPLTQEGKIFIDRDGYTFQLLLTYIRGNFKMAKITDSFKYT